MSIEHVYDRFLDFCRPAEPVAPWPRAAAECEAYIAPDRAREVLDWLDLEFGREAVIESGLASDLDGRLLPAAQWPGPDTLIVPWRDAPSDPPFDLLVDTGSLRGDGLPLLSALRDHHTRPALVKQHGAIIVATSLPELVALRSAGMAVTTPQGLRNVTSEHLAAIEAAWPVGDPLAPVELPAESSLSAAESDGDGRGDPAHDSGEADHASDQAAAFCSSELPVEVNWPHQLVVLAWTPSRLSSDPPVNLLEVCMTCAGANGATGIDVPWEAVQWRPSPNEIDQIRRALRAGSRTDLHEALLCSSFDSRFELFGASQVGQQPTYAAARQAYLDALSGRDGQPVGSSLDVLKCNLVAAHERDFVQPLLERALAARNPMRRAIYVAAAEHLRRMLQTSLELDAELASGGSSAGRGGRHATTLKLRAQQIRDVDALIRLQRELTR